MSIQEQYYFAVNNTKYWSNRSFKNNEIPVMKKDTLRLIEPSDLFPKNKSEYKTFKTSGTTGVATRCIWSKEDWNFLTQSISSQLISRMPKGIELVVNGYSMSHLSGNLYLDIFRKCNYEVVSLEKYLKSSSRQSKKVLIINPNTIPHKVSVGLNELLENDPCFLQENNFKLLIASSTPVSQKLKCNVLSMYGCSEIGYLGFSCIHNPNLFHLFNTFVEVEILDEDNKHVSHNERGRIIVTRLKCTSSQIIRLDIQDSAKYLKTKLCSCGFCGISLEDIKRA